MIRLYGLDVRPLFNDAMFERAVKLVTPQRRERISRFANRDDAARSLGGDLLLVYALKKDFNYNETPSFIKGSRGKPYLAKGNPIYFSKSHSGDYALCAISDEGEIGVDIQQVVPARMNVANRIFTPADIKKLSKAKEHERADLFCELWACHESAVKLFGTTVFDRHSISKADVRLIACPPGYKVALAIEKK